MSEPIGCARPTGKVMGEGDQKTAEETQETKEVGVMGLRAGMKAPDFESPAYHKGTFKTVRLSDSLGHWVLLCFYPGDFTFV